MPFQRGNKLAAGKRDKRLDVIRRDLIEQTYKNREKLNSALIGKAINGEIPAIKEVLDRTLGKSTEFVDVTSGGQVLPRPILANVIPSNDSNKKDNKAQ